MRGHDQTSRRQRDRAWLGTLLLAAAALHGAARGQGPTPDRDAAPQSSEPIDLAARRVSVWQADGSQWALLSGQASVLQGVEGPHADNALARITRADAPGRPGYRVVVYAEGPGPPARVSLRTGQEVRLVPGGPDGVVKLAGPPAGLPLLARSGLLPPGPRASRPAPQPTGAPRKAPKPPRLLPTTQSVTVAAAAPEATPPQAAKRDPALVPAQAPDTGGGFGDGGLGADGILPAPVEAPPLELPSDLPELAPPAVEPAAPPTELDPLPGGGLTPSAPAGPRPAPRSRAPRAPIDPGSQRVTRIYPRTGSPLFDVQTLPTVNGVQTTIVRGGVHIVTQAPQFGTLDLSADSAVIWRRTDPNAAPPVRDSDGRLIEDARQPMEVYLEGDVIVKQDERKVAGNGDQRTYRAKQAYYDLLTERFVGLDAEVGLYAPGLLAPTRILSPRIEQYRPFLRNADGSVTPGLAEIRADRTTTTGSRFPTPGYRFNSKSVDVFRVVSDNVEPNSGKAVGGPNAEEDLTWHIDARQNAFYMGKVPVFYWPRFSADADDLEPPIRQFGFRTNNVFGQQALTDWNGFRLFNVRKPRYIDLWNVDIDYLSYRSKKFPALGSEIGWFGKDLVNDLTDPYGQRRGRAPSWASDYFGYFDIWGLRDSGRDILGGGPAIITNNRAAGNLGYQRGGGGKFGAVPPFQDFRGRLLFRHMQRLLPDDADHAYEDFRVQLETGYSSDRYFIEEYYKRLFDVGLDQETLAYAIKQKDNAAFTVLASANLQNWYTSTQYAPKLDYYRLGDSLLGNRLTYFQSTGVDYANVHTASEVNNPYIFAFLPYDPVSNTSGVFKSGRAYTSHELDAPLNFFDNVLRVVPYAQGQAVGWSNQINGSSLGRLWGAVGARAEVMAWKAYPWVESELWNVHGLNHKINAEADFRDAFSNLNLNQVGLQDQLDDNSYESTRRYFALTNYAGGLLPAQYDPRFLVLRRAVSPITGTTDVQATIETLHLGLHQRLQTKRGPEGRRRIIDYMTFDLDTTYFPNAARDNFHKPFGQNMYNWQWFVGDRTSIVSYGWFEFFNITGNPIYKTNVSRHNDPFGLNVITSGVSISRPPRGNVFLGYTVINTGPITTSALNASLSYWLSPKWYGSFSTMYDFGNAILLGSQFSVTRIGADYLTTVGLSVDPQRQSYMFAFSVSPRLSPNIQLGAGVGTGAFDARYAPTQ